MRSPGTSLHVEALPTRIARRVAIITRKLDLTELAAVGSGVEGVILKARSATYGLVAVKVPRLSRYGNANDPDTEVGDLYRQEFRLLQHLRGHGFSVVPEPLAFDESVGREFLMMEWIEGDGTRADAAAVGQLIQTLHRIQPPHFETAAQMGLPTAELLPRRLHRRILTLGEIAARRWRLPPEAALTALLANASSPECLLHLDVRYANLICSDGRVRALLDWSNALLGPPALELARIAEISDLDSDRFLSGYHEKGLPPAGISVEELCYRLDAAVMLALVFTAEAPDAERAQGTIERVDQLCGELSTAFDR